ncbi:lipid-A-disaccharide synthase [Pseudohoeflea coraliihabitans]|uniref:Lipid-A-disaccharide synthase n=1 Tax=Pseudohoeflea coraliihabitans TaxID=2860393 RepID=A0ABS6WTU7_9HYPH|nr:lipid-A-disaccharide synthase [Pseudohoeflea sp. DP4N28-3]MBW3098490.1 lipid-A-disaccharide synthase [Pseudohoeflea sp. DP4N28-3]
MTAPRIAIIAGEASGDTLAAGLVNALNARLDTPAELVGVGGPQLVDAGLSSLFDYTELSLMGFSEVIAKLPRLLARIRQTAQAIIAARPDCLIIVDSPDFTHRVARRVKAQCPDLPVINYVCPTVWAWKPERAARMRSYIDHVLSVLPFEPEVVARLGGPPLTYVGHRLTSVPGLTAAHEAQQKRRAALQEGTGPRGMPASGDKEAAPLTCLLLPGSRRGEITRLAADIGQSAAILAERQSSVRFLLPVATGREELLRTAMAGWTVPVELVEGEAAKWQAFGEADVAIAASGTVLLELALAGVPAVSLYRVDSLSQHFTHLIKTWSAALPNLIADRVVIHEFFQQMIRPERIARMAEQLARDGLTRRAALADLDLVHRRMQVPRQPEDRAADIVLELLRRGSAA